MISFLSYLSYYVDYVKKNTEYFRDTIQLVQIVVIPTCTEWLFVKLLSNSDSRFLQQVVETVIYL